MRRNTKVALSLLVAATGLLGCNNTAAPAACWKQGDTLGHVQVWRDGRMVVDSPLVAIHAGCIR